MHLRVPFLEGRVLGLDAVSVGYGPLVYPGGSVPYLYGSSLLRYMEDRYGPEKIREISHRYADECIAGGINRVAGHAARPRPTRARSATDIWNDWSRSASHRYALQKEEAERRGLTTARRLTFDAPSPRGTLPRPVFFRDGTLIYQRENNDERRPTCASTSPPARARRCCRRTAAGRPRPRPTGAALVFQRVNFIPLGWRISGNAHLELERHLPLRPRARGRSGR